MTGPVPALRAPCGDTGSNPIGCRRASGARRIRSPHSAPPFPDSHEGRGERPVPEGRELDQLAALDGLPVSCGTDFGCDLTRFVESAAAHTGVAMLVHPDSDPQSPHDRAVL